MTLLICFFQMLNCLSSPAVLSEIKDQTFVVSQFIRYLSNSMWSLIGLKATIIDYAPLNLFSSITCPLFSFLILRVFPFQVFVFEQIFQLSFWAIRHHLQDFGPVEWDIPVDSYKLRDLKTNEFSNVTWTFRFFAIMFFNAYEIKKTDK